MGTLSGGMGSAVAAALVLSGSACSTGLPPAPAVTGLLPGLVELDAGTTALLQAVSPVNDRVVWISGHAGTWARSEDGGETWRSGVVRGADTLQFRDLYALDARRAWLLSAGNGDVSRIYYTEDGGETWTEQFRNGNSRAFYDCLAFWDERNGLALSDGTDGRFPLLATRDGKTWTLLPEPARPAARPGEGAFAASGTCLVTVGDNHAWFGTGAAAEGRARVIRTNDRGRSWLAIETPIPSGPAAGIATVAFRDRHHGVALGGDLARPDSFTDNVAVTEDGGSSWTVGARPPFPGAIYGAAYEPGTDRPALVAVGPRGAAVSWDDAQSWSLIDTRAYWSVGIARGGRAWLVGPGGRIHRFDIPPGPR
jgi:photosystem II stability/assembly factor-like uncharacterized protein